MLTATMDYPLENLGPERFQEFCQALLTREYPGLQCFPVGQPDGGRDALLHRRISGRKESALFQVKFLRRAELTEGAHTRLVSTMKTEIENLDRSVLVGVDKYILLTNVTGTAHLKTGSMDLLQAALQKGLPIPAEVWWRGDIARRLDTAWDIKWAYPEILTGPDLLRALIESGLQEEQSRRTTTIRAFLVDQFGADQEVKFKQVELQNRLIELFVDVPALPLTKSDRGAPAIAQHAYSRAAQIRKPGDRERLRGMVPREVVSDDSLGYRDERSPVGAASLLLDPYFQMAVPRMVLEGAPGQGKSTIGQYVCQIHRARLLARNEMLEKIPSEHKTGPVRLPFRIDLRDLATWLSRKDPFNIENAEEPKDWQKSLESFLCAQVRHFSGGAPFSVSDLHAVLRTSSLLIVFDGLDEVADVARRREIVDEVARSTGRLSEITLSLQVVVTSRPAAFANSPGPAERDFPYFQLDSLPPTLVVDYSERWLKAKRMADREAAELRKLLREKLSQPHMRDLARNPMQLAILLSLMHTRGVSLPDKRTALYDNYIDLFFSREAEKSPTVREHRDLLIGIHGHLAWLLHGEAQEKSTSGSITDDRLRDVVRAYLATEGHETSLVDLLFTGMVERVVALVSRVQGTYEFEVQPLREYFAARYLYETAPYSPAGKERTGTRPDRFDALVRDFYWLNVTRFYAGCFSKGELPALVDRIEALLGEAPYKYTAHPRVLAAMLLSDWVFSQHPRSVTTLVKLILEGVGLRAIAAGLSHRSRSRYALVLPKSSGRDDLVKRAFSILEHTPPKDFAMALIDVLRSNGTAETLECEWRSRLTGLPNKSIQSWLEYAQYLGLTQRIGDGEFISICSSLDLDAKVKVFFLSRRTNLFALADRDRNADTERAAVKALLDNEISPLHRFRPPTSVLEQLAAVIDRSRYIIGVRHKNPYPLRASWRMHGDDGSWLDEIQIEDAAPSWKKIINTAIVVTKRPTSEWATSLVPWSTLVDAIVDAQPNAWSAVLLSCLSAGITSAQIPDGVGDDFFDQRVSLCYRMRAARLKAGQDGWWSRTVAAAAEPVDVMIVALTFVVWGSARSILANLPALENAIARLPKKLWQKLIDSISSVQSAIQYMNNNRSRRSQHISAIPQEYSDRMLPILLLRGSVPVRLSLYSGRLASYRGKDRCLLDEAQSIAFELLLSPDCDWDRELAVIAHAYKNGVMETGRGEYYVHKSVDEWIPLPSAMHIAESADRYPSMLVQQAQAVCAANASKNVVTVAEKARQEQWFKNG